ncbi:MAG: DPP IV N-terminal domain-containing protein [Alistipes sp.]|nr:DPP IV N-terminal domain-containing protein [Alistipes sp.]
MTFNRSRLAASCLAALLTLAATCTYAQDDYDKVAQRSRANKRISGMRPMADGEHYSFRSRQGVSMRSYADRNSDSLLQTIPFAWTDYALSPDESSILTAEAAPLRTIYRRSYSTDWQLAPLGGEFRKVLEDARDVTFSPDGKSLAFARANNMYIFDIESGRTTPVTRDGERNRIINGTTDWVYEEEYGFTRAYAFSPDSRRLAYLRFDESRVPTASIVRYDFSERRDSTLTFKYPRAGEANSAVTLHIYDTADGSTLTVDTGSDTDQYIPRIFWTPAGELAYYRVNRRQNIFETVLLRADGTQKVIYREESPLYVERPDEGTITFIDNDRFLVREESTAGYMHLYLHSVERGRLNAVTSGPWEVTSLVAADTRNVWYISTEESPLRRTFYRTGLNGKGKKRLSEPEGWSSIAAGTGMKYFVKTRSSANEPDVVTVHRTDGRAVDTLADSRAAVAALGTAVRRDFFTFTTERGDELNAYMVLPRGFDPSRRYPVMLTQYSGPGSQQVRDRWSVDWEDALADHDIIVVCADGRGTGFRGEAFKKITTGRLGELEVEDQLSLARHMASQEYVDAGRIGIYGWSYGGFMALGCALKGDGLFKAAIAVAPVTSWRYYDSIYTEIYNGLPQENPSGYDDNSPVTFAGRLSDRTRLLIMHGSSDDNVHLKNTMEMTRALTRAGKRFEVMIYPDQNHSMMPDNTADIRRKMINFMIENL